MRAMLARYPLPPLPLSPPPPTPRRKSPARARPSARRSTSSGARPCNATTGISLNYQAIGSGAGINQINNRTVDFGASDMPLTGDPLDSHN